MILPGIFSYLIPSFESENNTSHKQLQDENKYWMCQGDETEKSVDLWGFLRKGISEENIVQFNLSWWEF